MRVGGAGSCGLVAGVEIRLAMLLSHTTATSVGGAASTSREQRLATVGGSRWLGLAIMISIVFAVGSSSVFKKALAPLALSASAPSMIPTL